MQVVAGGRPIANLTSHEYYGRIEEMREVALAAYDRLASRYDIIVLEGAGSPAEINLRDVDIVNASMAEYAEARCLLVADIDRGGVFATILGTVSLLPDRHRKLLSGIVINKFRGDVSLLDPGIREIEGLTGIPVLGVLPHLGDLGLEEEDSLALEGRSVRGSAPIDIAVIRFPFLSNYTDFQPLESLPKISLRYVSQPLELGNPDLIVLPGSKNVRHDADYLVGTGLDRVLIAAAARRIPLFGICGGYQILGRIIRDPHGIEGEPGETAGLGLLPVETVLEKIKELSRVEAVNLSLPFLAEGEVCTGYEIHMGRTRVTGEGRPLIRNLIKLGSACAEDTGCSLPSTPNGGAIVFGGYLHGLFETPHVRRGLLQWLFERKGLTWDQGEKSFQFPVMDPLERLADALETHLNLEILR